MKHLRLILLMLVAWVTQASMAQTSTLKMWEEAAKIEEKVTDVLLYAQKKDAANAIDTCLPRKYLDYEESINHVSGFIRKIQKKLPKWDEKLSKGKKIDYDDALRAAVFYASGYVMNQPDYAKAAQYFELAATSANDTTQKAVLQLSAVGCRYQVNKDRAATAAAINFHIPANCTTKLFCIANKYDIHDIVSEKLRQVFNVSDRRINRAIRSKNIEELKKYESYDIPEVDSVLARNQDSEELYWKCLMKHDMFWPLLYSQSFFWEAIERTDLPAKAFKYTFLTPASEGATWKYRMLGGIVYDLKRHNEEATLKLLNQLKRRSDVAAFTMSIIIQSLAQQVYGGVKRDFRVDLCEFTAQLLGDDESEKAKVIENVNNTFGKYFSINSSGVVTLKFQAPDLHSPDETSKAKIIELYEMFANWIGQTEIMDYEPAVMPSKNVLKKIFELYTPITLDSRPPIKAVYTIEAEGVISIDILDASGKSLWIEGVSHNVKTNCKPAMRGGKPYETGTEYSEDIK